MWWINLRLQSTDCLLGGAGVFFFLKEKGGLESRQSLWWINETVRKANINIKVLPMYVHVL